MSRAHIRKIPKDREAFYHWSPVQRRNGILRHGLMPGSHSVDRLWKPPYVCLSDEPRLAWILSGALHPEVEAWDLWMVYCDDIGHAEAIFEMYRDGSGHYVKEWRVYHRIYKRHVQYLASRTV